ncbi:MAG: pilus assembly protein CpaB [Pseudonocardiales bacterium]|jgi:pilus assembly protein CpaB|nr:pilus assembly protein CpaB [Pseudonocardiales bacterium]
MNRRILMIAAAVILALLGTGAVYSYVKNADTRALAGKQAVNVLITVKRIPAGTTASDVRSGGYTRTDHLPSDATPQGSVSVIDTAWDSQVTTTDVQPGQVVLRAMFGTKQPTTSGLAIPGKMVAVSIKLSTDGDVAGYVQPGSQIAIFDTFILLDGKGVPSGNKTGGDKNDNWATKLLLPRVDVLAVSQSAPQGTKGNGSSPVTSTDPSTAMLLVTVAVSQQDAERLIHVARTGMPYAALLSNDSLIAPGPGVDNHNRLAPVFPGGIKAP